MSEENSRQQPRQDPRQQDPNITMTTFLRRGALGGKVVFLGVGIALIGISLGRPERILLIAIGCTLIGYSGDLLVGWGALRNYGKLYELVAEVRAEQRRNYLDTLSRLAELRNGTVEILDNLTEIMDALTRQLTEIRDMMQRPKNEIEQRRQGSG